MKVSLDDGARRYAAEAGKALRSTLSGREPLDRWVDSLPRPVAHLCEEALHEAAQKPLPQIEPAERRKVVAKALDLLGSKGAVR
jgi:hypothetical protein